MRRLLVAVVALALVVSAAPAAGAGVPATVPPVDGFPVPSPPEVGAETWVLFDDTYGVVLGAEGADVERALASTTKIMTALVALEEGDLDSQVAVSARAAGIGEAEIGLVPGERLPLKALVAALLVRSANDAAVATAEAVGGSVEGFVGMMNDKAEELGLEHTSFANPHGLDAPGHYSSAADLLTLARVAMENPEFAEMVAARKVALRDAPDGTRRVAKTTNGLFERMDGVIGVKTGFTSRAALVMVAAAERDGRRLYAVVMGSKGRGGHFDDAQALLEYGFESFGVVPVIVAGEPYATLRTSSTEKRLTAAASVEALVHLSGARIDEPRLAVEGDRAVISVDAPEAQSVELDRREPDPLPGVEDAFGWVGRYWEYLTGDG